MMVVDGAAAGCAVSTSITRACMLVLLILYMRFSGEHTESFNALKAGFVKYFYKHKKELLVLTEKINNNESIQYDSGSSDGHRGELEMIEAGSDSAHSHDENDDEDDTDTLLSSNRDMSRSQTRSGDDSSGNGRFPSLFQTKRDVMLFLSLGIPGGLVLIVELWTFDIATVVVSQIGK